MTEWIDDAKGWFESQGPTVLEVALIGSLAIAIGLLAHYLIFRLLLRIAAASEGTADDLVVRELKRPSRWAMVALALVLAARELPALDTVWQKIAGFVIPAIVGWIVLAAFHALMGTMKLRADITVADNLRARRRQTRLTIFSRIGTFVIVFLTIGMMLLSIPGVRDVGVTLMASAGLAALAVGAAAQPALKSLIAGLQMALTEPISIDDVVIIEGEWGRIEDIRTTYVVVRTWDERRLVVPTSKFLEETFQNWTRESAQLLAPVFLHLDPAADISAIRTEFERIAAENPLWDGRVKKLQVTEMSPGSIEVRLLMSASDSGTAFDLRCEIREAMLAWLRENQPEAIARRRVDPVTPAALAAD
jgi:small-conductance mechanosensitive channel